MQALSASLAIPLTAVALGVGFVTFWNQQEINQAQMETFRDQQEINRAQMESARREHERYEQRFASRVAAWRISRPPDVIGAEPGPVLVRLQNRSLFPIKDVLIDVNTEHGQGTYWVRDDVPPCSLMTLQLGGIGKSDVDPWTWVFMWFQDTVGRWHIGSEGLKPVIRGRDDGLPVPGLDAIDGEAVELRDRRETAADCGGG